MINKPKLMYPCHICVVYIVPMISELIMLCIIRPDCYSYDAWELIYIFLIFGRNYAQIPVCHLICIL